MKVCGTCRFWSRRYKGFCERLQQGVGRFWMCEDWCEGARAEEELSPPVKEKATP